MKITLNWLYSHLNSSCSTEQILDGLMRIGLEVEEVIDYNQMLANFTVAEITEVTPHPDANSLNICTVQTASGVNSVVCGAHNVRVGLKAIYASEGHYIPGSGIVLKKTKIRGVESSGMLLSAREMSLGDDHDGIIEVDSSANIGDLAAKVLGVDDLVIDLSITPNMGFILGVRNIATELTKIGLGELKPLSPKVLDNFNSKGEQIKIDVDASISDSFSLAKLENITLKPSPQWMQNRLNLVGIQPKNLIIDITNYICLDLNQPMHAYDFNCVGNNVSVKSATAETKILALNQEEYNVQNGDIVVCAGDNILGLAGVIGENNCAINDGTSSILLESAHFNSANISATRKRLGLTTEASYRFERGTNAHACVDNLRYAIALLLECDPDIKYIECCNVSNLKGDTTYTLSVDYINSIIGTSFTQDKALEIFKNLGFTVSVENNELAVVVSSYRSDIKAASDLITEVIKYIGFDALTEVKPVADQLEVKYDNSIDKTALHLITQGYTECLNMAFISNDLNAKCLLENNEELELHNPISVEYAIMRSSLVPSLLLNVVNNQNYGTKGLKIFEVAKTFNINKEKLEQSRCLSGALYGYKHYKDWQNKNAYYTVYDAKQSLFEALQSLGLTPDNLPLVTNQLPAYYHPNKSGSLALGKNGPLAHFGEIHPSVLANLDIKAPVVAFELLIDKLPPRKQKAVVRKAHDISNLMALERDFSFTVQSDVQLLDLVKYVQGVNKKLIQSVRVFDIFQTQEMKEEGKLSVAVNVVLQPKEKTLTEEEIKDIYDNIILTAQTKVGAILNL